MIRMEANATRLRPTDNEIITYLAHKASGQSPAPEDYINIPTIDVYGNLEPWELFEELLEQDRIHFFSISNLRKREDRSVGAWKLCPDKTEDIVDLRSDQLVGLVKRYEYTNPSEAQHDRMWILDEYTLKGCVTSQYKGLSFCTLIRTDSLYMWSTQYLPKIKCSRKMKRIICPDWVDPDVC